MNQLVNRVRAALDTALLDKKVQQYLDLEAELTRQADAEKLTEM